MAPIAEIFRNDHWLVVDKPHGWLTTPSRNPNDPRPCLGRDLQQREGRQIFPVHRLDFEVSGLVLWALDASAQRRASSAFESGQMHKTYEALTGVPSSPTFELNQWLEWRCKIVRGKRRSFVAEHGKLAITRARCTQVMDEAVRWELEPLTGRPHQLRLELARHQAPILGDSLYGGPAWNLGPPQALALRAVALMRPSGDEATWLGLPERLKVEGDLRVTKR